jgi:hypothetical protein
MASMPDPSEKPQFTLLRTGLHEQATLFAQAMRNIQETDPSAFVARFEKTQWSPSGHRSHR